MAVSLVSVVFTQNIFAQVSAAPESLPLRFFVTSVGLGSGVNLGGLAGADAHCSALATVVGAGERDWRACCKCH
ncbi:MAG: hypothetical protein P8J68_10505 [Arenicellaceae bacterium]|nr:hypothetical protein [Arenicellaceae bacterium]